MKLSLNTQILLGALFGVGVGILLNVLGNTHPVYHPTVYFSEIIGDFFVNLLKMVLIPLVFTSITVGIANLRAHAQMDKVWKYTMIYFLVTPIIAAILGLTVINIAKPGVGLNIDLFKDSMSMFHADQMSIAQFFKTFLSSMFVNPVTAMAQGNVFAIVVFALILGIALVVTGPKAKTILNFLNEFFDIIMLIVQWIMRLAPFGIMALLAKLIATQNVGLFTSLGLFMAVVAGTTLFHGIVILPGILYILTKFSPFKFFAAMQEALVTAFSTSSSSATMPVTMRCLERNLKVDKDIAGFVLPLGTTVNMDGTAMYEAAAALFIANIVGIELNLVQQCVVVITAVIASIGAPGIPSAGMVTMVMVLQSVGLPVEAIAILLPIDRPLDAIRTMVNVEGDAVCSLIVQKYASK